VVRHRFPDAQGTELDGGEKGAGRFRVLLHVEDNLGSQGGYRQDWASQGVVVVSKWLDAVMRLAPCCPDWLEDLSRGVDAAA